MLIINDHHQCSSSSSLLPSSLFGCNHYLHHYDCSWVLPTCVSKIYIYALDISLGPWPRWICPNMWTTGTCLWRQMMDTIMGEGCLRCAWFISQGILQHSQLNPSNGYSNQAWYSYRHTLSLKHTFRVDLGIQSISLLIGHNPFLATLVGKIWVKFPERVRLGGNFSRSWVPLPQKTWHHQKQKHPWKTPPKN